MDRVSRVLLGGAVFGVASAAAWAQAPEAHLAITSMTDNLPGDGHEAANPPTPTPIAHRFVVTNHGPSAVTGAVVTELTGGTTGAGWTCVASPGSSCPSNGSGGSSFSTTVDLASGGTASFEVLVYFEGDIPPLVVNRARVAAPAGTLDPNPGDDVRTLMTYRVGVAQALGYHPLPPCRLVDTRDDQAPFRGGETRDVPVAGQFCGVPAEARAVVLNLTAVAPTETGNLRLYPMGRWATLSSALNFTAGQTRANIAVARLGQGGIGVQCDLPLRSTGQVQVVIDVYGWFR